MAEKKRQTVSDEAREEVIVPKESQASKSAPESVSPASKPFGAKPASSPLPIGRYVWAVILILAGVALLLNTNGVLPWIFWLYLVQFWPIALIIIGFNLLFGKNRLAQLLVMFIGLALLVGATFISAVSAQAVPGNWTERLPWLQNWSGSAEEQRYEKLVKQSDFEGVETRVVDIAVGAGSIDIDEAEDDDLMAKLVGSYFGNASPMQMEAKRQDDELVVKVQTPNSPRMFMHWRNPASDYRLTLGQPDVATQLKLDIGAGKADVVLSQTRLRQVEVNIGAGEVDMQLGTTSIPTSGMLVDVGAGSARIRIPESIALVVRHDVGIGRLTVDGQDVEDGDTYRDAGQGDSPRRLELTVDIGVGNVEIVRE